MKLNCGLSREERLQVKVEKLSNWHRHFAWVPVKVSHNDCRWLEFVERKSRYDKRYHLRYDLTEFRWDWQYRSLDNA